MGAALATRLLQPRIGPWGWGLRPRTLTLQGRTQGGRCWRRAQARDRRLRQTSPGRPSQRGTQEQTQGKLSLCDSPGPGRGPRLLCCILLGGCGCSSPHCADGGTEAQPSGDPLRAASSALSLRGHRGCGEFIRGQALFRPSVTPLPSSPLSSLSLKSPLLNRPSPFPEERCKQVHFQI